MMRRLPSLLLSVGICFILCICGSVLIKAASGGGFTRPGVLGGVQGDSSREALVPRERDIPGLSLTWGISPYETSDAILVTFQYAWDPKPASRTDAPIGISWDPAVFQMVDDSFHRYSNYTRQSGVGEAIIDDTAYANGSPAGIIWHAELSADRLGATGFYGHGEFLLRPKAAHGKTTLYGYYLHQPLGSSAHLGFADSEAAVFEVVSSGGSCQVGSTHQEVSF